MNADAYRSAIMKLGMSQRRAAEFLEIGSATGTRWARYGCPGCPGKFIRFMLALRVTPAFVDKLIDDWERGSGQLGRGDHGDV